jgi:hypothetical protein
MAVLIIVGALDGNFTNGSRLMAKTLTAAGIDTTLTELPGEGHGVWPLYYSKPGFYTWMLANRRGQPPAPDRPGAAQLLTVGLTEPADMTAGQKIDRDFKKFLPYWFLVNCSEESTSGLKPQLSGRSDVFVSNPLSKDIPCSIQYTATLPEGRKPMLHLLVGREPAKGAWQLSVLADGKEIFTQAIDPATCPKGWSDLNVDLSPYAGKIVHLEVRNGVLGEASSSAYWSVIEIAYP